MEYTSAVTGTASDIYSLHMIVLIEYNLATDWTRVEACIMTVDYSNAFQRRISISYDMVQ
jgi:hypothetical protein